MKRTKQPTPTVVQVLRMLADVTEAALASGDAKTVMRCADASQALYRNLRAAVAPRTGLTPV